MLESAFKNCLHEYARTVCDARHHHCRRLKVCRKPGIRHGTNELRTAQSRRCIQVQCIRFSANRTTCLLKAGQNRQKVVGRYCTQENLSARNGNSRKVCRRHNAVGHDRILGAEKLFVRRNNDRIASGALDVRTRTIHKRRKVGNLRLSCGIVNHGRPLGANGTQEDILRRTHRRKRKRDLRTVQAVGRTAKKPPAVLGRMYTHHFERRQMQINRAKPDGAAARRTQFRFAEACEKRTQKDD